MLVAAFFVTAPRILDTQDPLAAVVSGSMTPTIKVGDLLVVQGVNVSTLKPGDIIVYCSTDKALADCLIVHRIVRVVIEDGTVKGYITQGDNNFASDNGQLEPITGIPPSDVRGKVIFVIPLLGFLVIWLKNPAVFAVVVLLILAYTVADRLSKGKQRAYQPARPEQKYDKHSKSLTNV